MEEPIYFSHHGISVSESRFVINGEAIPIKSVTTVEIKRLKPNFGFARVCLFGGIALLFGHGNLPVIGTLSIALSVALWFYASPMYAVVIYTSTGEHQALIGKDILDAEIVLSALNIAIALRE